MSTKKTRESVLFVVLNYNGWQETLVCIDAILKQSYTDFHIVLIDNGSADESLKKLDSFNSNKKVTFIKNKNNLGFSGGVNQGINFALENDYTYTALLNNDAVVTKDWLKILIKTLETKKSSVATGLLLSGDGQRIESTGDSFSNFGLPFPRQRDEPVDNALASGYVFGGTAGASVYKTILFKDIGLFDEKFFAYYEDTDISYRAQLVGHKAYYEKEAVAYHDHGTTSSKIPGFTVYQTFKNLPLLLCKNIPLRLMPGTYVRFLTYYGLIYTRALLRGQFLVATKGVLRSIWLLPYALGKRRGIQKNRLVSINYLRSITYTGLPPGNKRSLQKILGRES